MTEMNTQEEVYDVSDLNQPLVSVVVPVYNVEGYLDSCVQSIRNQTYQNLEIILVDDGSTDESAAMCYRYGYEDARIKVVHKINGGLSDARNAGLEVATGEYITFVDADDTIDYQFVETLLKHLNDYHADIAITSYYNYFESTKTYGFANINREHLVEVVTKQEAMDYQCGVRPYLEATFSTAWGKLYKKSLFDHVRFPVGKLHEDEMTTHKLYLKANGIVLDNSNKYMYRIREGSIMRSADNLKRVGHVLEAYRIKLSDMVLANLDTTLMRSHVTGGLKEYKRWLEESGLSHTAVYLQVVDMLDFVTE